MAANWIIQNAMQLWAACKNPDRDGCFPHLTVHYIYTLNWKWEPWHLVMRHRLFKDAVCVCVYKKSKIGEKSIMCVSMGKWLLFGLAPCPLFQKTVKSEISSGSPSWCNSAWYVFLSCNCLFIGPLSKAILWRSLQACRLWKEGIIVWVSISGRISKWQKK